jgi:hypothetical protein
VITPQGRSRPHCSDTIAKLPWRRQSRTKGQHGDESNRHSLGAHFPQPSGPNRVRYCSRRDRVDVARRQLVAGGQSPTMLVSFARYSRDQSFAVLGRHPRFTLALGSIVGTFPVGLLLGVVPATVLLPVPAVILACRVRRETLAASLSHPCADPEFQCRCSLTMRLPRSALESGQRVTPLHDVRLAQICKYVVCGRLGPAKPERGRPHTGEYGGSGQANGILERV